MYPTDHDFIFLEFLDFWKYFLSTFLWIRRKPKQTFCIPKRLLKMTFKCSYSIEHSSSSWATCWWHHPLIWRLNYATQLRLDHYDFFVNRSASCRHKYLDNRPVARIFAGGGGRFEQKVDLFVLFFLSVKGGGCGGMLTRLCFKPLCC